MTHDPREALEPCPFCGGNAQIIEGEESAYVQCLDVKMHRALWVTGDNNAANEVAEQWNTRALIASPGEQEPVCQSCKRRLAVDLITGTAGLCCECVAGGFPLYLSPPPAAGQTERELAAQAALARVRKVRDGYANQAKFADVDQASYFREFVRRLDDAVNPKPSAPPWNGAALRREAPAPEGVASNYSKDIGRKMMEVADLIAATLDQPLDPRAWDHLLIYAPREALDRRLSTLNHGENHDAVLASYRPDDEVRERHVDRGRPEPRNANQVANEQSGNAPVRMEVLGGGNQGIGRPDAGGGVRLPHGYALVPTKPTPAMIEAGCEQNPTQWNEGTDLGFAADVANDVYVAMVSAAALSTPPAAVNSNASVEARLREALVELVSRSQAARDHIGSSSTLDNDGNDRFIKIAGIVEPLEHAIGAATTALSAVGDEAKKSEGGPLNWQLSNDAKARIAEIDANRRHAALNAGNIVAGSPTPSDPPDRREIVAREHPIQVAQRGFDVWAAKEHNKKWFKRIDGTPIPNDLVVCIAMEFAALDGGAGA